MPRAVAGPDVTFGYEFRSGWPYRCPFGFCILATEDAIWMERDRMQNGERTDPELMGHSLDLTRPELRPLLDRYAPRSVLIVGRQAVASALKDALIDNGWRVRGCEGPGRTRCPLLEGKPSCDLRAFADVAVVYIDGAGQESGLLPRLRCAADPASPVVISLEGRLDPPMTEKRHGVVGALRGPDTIARLVARVSGPDPRVARMPPPSSGSEMP